MPTDTWGAVASHKRRSAERSFKTRRSFGAFIHIFADEELIFVCLEESLVRRTEENGLPDLAAVVNAQVFRFNQEFAVRVVPEMGFVYHCETEGISGQAYKGGYDPGRTRKIVGPR